ncbi:hypothetical protein ACVBEQ_27400 [Nakamurella sp. GG22]
MSDLFDQLRAYGRQIEADHGVDAAGPAPAGSVVVQEEPRSAARSRRSTWVLVAAATAAVALSASLLFPAASPNGKTRDYQRSDLVGGVCLSVVTCTSSAERTDTGVAGQPAPSTSGTAAVPPPLFDGSPDITAGTYSLDLRGVPMQITIPAGWVRHEDFYLTAGPEDTSDGFVAFFDVTDVYKDPCNWIAGKAEIGPTVDDLVAGLQAQPGLQTSAPEPLNVDGLTGTELTFSTPADLDLSTCYTGTFALWTIASGGPTDRQISSTPGDTGTVWILDLNGKRGVISFGSDEPTSDTSAQIKEMVGSLTIG